MRFQYLFLLVVIFFAFFSIIDSAGCNSKTPYYGEPNMYPILDGNGAMTFLKQVHNGKLYSVNVNNDGGNTSSTFNVIHVWGNPYEMGFAQGTLMKDNLKDYINSVWLYFEAQVEEVINTVPIWLAEYIADLGLDVALDATYEATKFYTNPDIFEELKGISDASGIDYNTIVRVHMIAGLTEGKCSMFGASGPALDPTSSTKLLQLRALDWNMDGPFRDFPSITVYHPHKGKGYAYANIGMIGFIGGLTGMSENRLAISEIGVSYPDNTFGSESRIGIPFIFLLRDILALDYTVDDATSRMITTRRTCDLILGVGDGKLSQFKGYQYSYSTFKVVNDIDLIPKNDTWHPQIPGIVYWAMDWMCPADNLVLSEQLKNIMVKLHLKWL